MDTSAVQSAPRDGGTNRKVMAKVSASSNYFVKNTKLIGHGILHQNIANHNYLK